MTDRSFKSRRRYAGVRRQQGRVHLDADWNEAEALRDESGKSSGSARNRLTAILIFVCVVLAYLALRRLRRGSQTTQL